MADLRHCRWCRHPIAFGNLNSQRVRPAHCANPQCDWCQPCKDRRDAAIKAGFPLDQPVVPPESPAEQTREIPAVTDTGGPPVPRWDEPPPDPTDPTDQMT